MQAIPRVAKYIEFNYCITITVTNNYRKCKLLFKESCVVHYCIKGSFISFVIIRVRNTLYSILWPHKEAQWFGSMYTFY